MGRLDGFRTLLLDSGCRPLRSIPWERALVLDLADRIDVLDYYDEVVHTPSTAFPLPAVVRLRQYLRYLHGGVAFSRRNVLVRDDFCCQYCGERPPLRKLTLDHVVPRSKGGPTCWENIVTACERCNRRKGSKAPAQVGLKLRREPVQPEFLPHRAGIGGEVPVQWQPYLEAS